MNEIWKKKVAKEVAAKLLEIKAIKLSPTSPFTWASGWKSPIYCDNRKTLSYPEVRTLIKKSFVALIQEIFPEVDVIAGVATGAIAQGALVADEMEKGFVYVRSSPKAHGLENLVEGEIKEGQNVVVVEDLISTGGSSLQAVEALRKLNCNVLGMVAIFTYGFPQAELNFENKSVKLFTLSDYESLLEIAIENEYIKPDVLEILKQWRINPEKF